MLRFHSSLDAMNFLQDNFGYLVEEHNGVYFIYQQTSESPCMLMGKDELDEFCNHMWLLYKQEDKDEQYISEIEEEYTGNEQPF